MDLNKRISYLVSLGEVISHLLTNKNQDYSRKYQFKETIVKAEAENLWFKDKFIIYSLKNILHFLNPKMLKDWINKYPVSSKLSEREIAVIMAGNIPLVSFHDMLCVIMSGHKLICKLSSKDKVLPKLVVRLLNDISPKFKNRIKVVEGKLPKKFDTVIATGSSNSARYFKSYFQHVPYIIRKNRTSLAVLIGDETKDDLQNLGKDIFTYYGLGCRNVSKLFIPKNFDIKKILDSWKQYEFVINNHKYANNYDYNRIILQMNNISHFDNGFAILKEDQTLFSPISVVHFQYYEKPKEIIDFIEKEKNNTQCIVGKNRKIGFGETQKPNLSDYADNVNTMDFLINFEKR